MTDHQLPEYIDVFAHEEYNWLRHPISHLRQVGIRRKAGRRKMRRWTEGHDIDGEADPDDVLYVACGANIWSDDTDFEPPRSQGYR